MDDPTDAPPPAESDTGISAFRRFLARARELGGLHDDDVVALIVPVLEAARTIHDEGRVLDLAGLAALRVEEGRLALDLSAAHEPIRSPKVGIVTSARPISRLAEDDEVSRAITERLVPGYSAWEHRLGHHDALCDIHVLGLVMASLACGLDLETVEQIERLEAHRERLHELAPKAHPVLVRTILACTNARRAERPQDLGAVIARLEARHRIDLELGVDLSTAPGFRNQDTTTRENWILSRLRRRLFDSSRRNRLLHFRRSAGNLDLAVASVPLAVDAAHVPIERIMVWNDELASRLAASRQLALHEFLDLAREPELVVQLDRIRSDARKARFEFGVDALRLVVAFLHWTDTRTSPSETVVSPLVLLPVALVRPRGARSKYEVRCESLEAEINPVLSLLLHDRFGVVLPAGIDLAQTNLTTLVDGLRAQLATASSTFLLELRETPDLEALLQERVRGKPRPPAVAPDHWVVDATRPTLGSFASRRMSFVRDYDDLLSRADKGAGFGRLFATAPREALLETPVTSVVPAEPLVVPADPTQRRAVRVALAAQSYVIQGPPGTGKSQTITNLIAALAAAGKRVLFVCQKRAALDVVAHRLRERGLAEITCRIHDAVADKRAFIADLRERYERLCATTPEEDTACADARARLAARLAPLANFEARMASSDGVEPATPRELLEILARSPTPSGLIPSLSAPAFAVWAAHRDAVSELARRVGATGRPPIWAMHPLSFAPWSLWREDDPRPRVAAAIDAVEREWRDLGDVVAILDSPPDSCDSLADVRATLGAASRIAEVAQRERLDVFEPSSAAAREVDSLLAEFAAGEVHILALAAKTAPWREKLAAEDARRARDHWRASHRRWLRVFDGRWRRIRKIVRKQFDFARHQVPPTVLDVLEDLCSEHDARERQAAATRALAERYGFASFEAARELLAILRNPTPAPPWSRLAGKTTAQVTTLAAALPKLDALQARLEEVHEDPARLAPARLSPWLEEVRAALPGLRGLAPALAALAEAPPALIDFVRTAACDPAGLERIVAASALAQVRAEHHEFDTLEAAAIAERASQAAADQRALLDLNVEQVRRLMANRFLDGLRESAKTDHGWREGRRILEHEFGKSMRFLSARELLAGPARDVMLAMKPVWLMSPQSVADVLPIDAAMFDVVIFDEASQITLEEGLPTALRAQHAIVVGDEMQMPPTDFFSTAASDEVDEEDESVEWVATEIDVDSLLDQAARKLPSVMLGWHYRSQNEALISYANAAFYGRELLTVPSPSTRDAAREPIVVTSSADAVVGVDAMFDRPISFHRCEHATYSARRNLAEAEYVAELVRGLLARESTARRVSIGVVAFSIEQQGAIEAALDALAATDSEFAQRLEEEYAREDDGQFVGLFVKNLENVQGDERDIIIMSVCYGRDRDSKIRMNFGPINQRGGEKRLNVIMSRARIHMAVVSSMSGASITNLHNRGAAHLAGFLQYAERMSVGDAAGAARLLDAMATRPAIAQAGVSSPTVRAIARGLVEAGLEVEHDVGDSAFRVDLAVRSPQHHGRVLGVMVDHRALGSVEDLLDRIASRPQLLRRFGWHVELVTLREWFDDPAKCIQRLVAALTA